MKRWGNESLKSLVSQLGICHSILKKFDKPVKAMVTGVGSQTLSILKSFDYDKWLLEFTDKNYTELFDKDKFIYLSGDAEEEMEEYDNK